MKDFDIFRRDWTGKCVDFDHTFKCQCVDLILQGLYEMEGITGVSGNAIDYWTHPSPNLVHSHEFLPTTDVRKADIVILRTYGHTDLQGDGHIGWATGVSDGFEFELLEQNGYGGGDGQPYPDGRHRNEIGTRTLPKSRIVGVIRRLVGAAPVHPCTYEDTPTVIKLTKNQPTHWYDLNCSSTDPAQMQVAMYLNADAEFKIVGYAQHINGHTYAMTSPDYENAVAGNYTTNNGIEIHDLKDKPPLVVATPPAAPTSFKPAEKLVLKTDLLAYASPRDAMASNTPKAELKAKTAYYVWNREGGATCLSTSNMTNNELWIDENKNVLTAIVVPPKITETIKEAAKDIPVPELDKDKWKASVAALKYDPQTGQPVAQYFWATNSAPLLIKDLDNKQPDFMMRPYNCDEKGIPHKIPIMMTIEKNGILYAWPKSKYAKHIYQCVPMFNLHPDKGNVLDASKDLLERVVTHTMRLGDHPKLAWYRLTRWLDGIKQTEPGKDQK